MMHSRWLTWLRSCSLFPSAENRTRRLWRALRLLNDLVVSEPEASLIGHVSTVMRRMRLRGRTRQLFVASAVPLLCQRDLFRTIEALLVDTGWLRGYADCNNNVYRMTLALPALVEHCEVVRAAEVLLKVAENQDDGWLNTDCIAYAVRAVQRLESECLIEAADAERFRMAWIVFLDGFQGDWFSRLHDQELTRSAVALIVDAERYGGAHRHAVVSAVIRHYGLSPLFWQLYQHTSPVGGELAEAREQWCQIASLLYVSNELNAEEVEALAPAIMWFSQQGNSDALIWMRELTANMQEETASPACRSMVSLLRRTDPTAAERCETDAIWPTCQSIMPGPNGNRLDLQTPAGQAEALLQQSLPIICVVRNEMLMLPHFLEHYRSLGIDCFLMVDNCSTDGTADYLLQQPDVVLYRAETEYRRACYGVAWQQALLGNHCLGKWVVIADADELLVYPEWRTRLLADYLNDVEATGADALLTLMIDMYPRGSLVDADFSKSPPFKVAPWHDGVPMIEWRLGSGQYSNAASYLSHLRHRLSSDSPPNAFTSQKVAVVRYQPWLRFSAGIHYAANTRIAEKPVKFAHFKYHAGFREKVTEEIGRGQHYNNAEEYRRYLDLLSVIDEGFWSHDSKEMSGAGKDSFPAALTS